MTLRRIPIPIQTCSGCKHWEQLYDASTVDPEDDFGHDWCKKLGKRWGNCERTSMSMGTAEDSLSIAVAMDGSHYAAHLETREDFGCMQWEAKPNEP